MGSSVLYVTEKYFIYTGIVSRDSFACLKTENILFIMELSALGVFVCLFDCLFSIHFSVVPALVLDLGKFSLG